MLHIRFQGFELSGSAEEDKRFLPCILMIQLSPIPPSYPLGRNHLNNFGKRALAKLHSKFQATEPSSSVDEELGVYFISNSPSPKASSGAILDPRTSGANTGFSGWDHFQPGDII